MLLEFLVSCSLFPQSLLSNKWCETPEWTATVLIVPTNGVICVLNDSGNYFILGLQRGKKPFCLTFITSMNCHMKLGFTKNMYNDSLKSTRNFLYGGKNMSINVVMYYSSPLLYMYFLHLAPNIKYIGLSSSPSRCKYKKKSQFYLISFWNMKSVQSVLWTCRYLF